MAKNLHESARAVHHEAKRDMGRALGRVALTAVTWSGVLAMAQVLHGDPSFFTHFNVPAVDGIAGVIYNSANFVGGFMNDHIPGVGFAPHLLAQTPIDHALNANLMADVEVLTTFGGVRQIARAARKGVDRNIAHTESVHGGNLADAPDSVKRHVQGMTALRTVLAVIDAGVEGVETVAEGPLPYGLRDLDSAGFLVTGWHPLTGEMSTMDKLVLTAGIATPYIPPIVPMSVWAFLKHVVRPTGPSKKASK